MSQTNNLQKKWKQFLSKKMDRKGFLAHIGAGAFAATGVASMMKSLDGFDTKDTKDSYSYGGGSYGGDEQSSKS